MRKRIVVYEMMYASGQHPTSFPLAWPLVQFDSEFMTCVHTKSIDHNQSFFSSFAHARIVQHTRMKTYVDRVISRFSPFAIVMMMSPPRQLSSIRWLFVQLCCLVNDPFSFCHL